MIEAALNAKEAGVRQRAAYVVSELGDQAKPCGPALLARLKIEPERLVRLYLAEALSAVHFRERNAIAELQRRFNALSEENVPRQLFGDTYAEVDEKIKFAAALFVLTEGGDRERYLAFVQKWLEPPPKELTGQQLEGYWERRWMASLSNGCLGRYRRYRC